ncbi:MAG: hypothetical protein AB7O62_12615 [Pirellulales bacterium]
MECAFSTVLVGALLVASLKCVTATTQSRESVATQRQATGLAEQLMMEIYQTNYVDSGSSPTFGPETGESTGNRSAFNDVDDYHNWSESPPKSKSGTAISGYTGWTRSVAVAFVQRSSLNTSGSETGLKRITVTVTDNSGRQTRLVGLRGQNGLGESWPSMQSDFVTWTGVQITTAAGGTPQARGTAIINRAKDQ